MSVAGYVLTSWQTTSCAHKGKERPNAVEQHLTVLEGAQSGFAHIWQSQEYP